MPKNPNTISPKQHKIAQMAIDGHSYTEIAEAVGIRGKYPRQNIYNRLHANGAKKALEQKLEKIEVNEEFVKQGLAGIAANGRQESARVAAYSWLGRTFAMFADRNINTNTELPPIKADLANIPTNQLLDEITGRLNLVPAGVLPSPSKDPIAIESGSNSIGDEGKSGENDTKEHG